MSKPESLVKRKGKTSEKLVTVNKIGGENMLDLDDVLNLVKVLIARGEAPVLVVSAFKGVTNGLIAAMDSSLDGTNYNEKSITLALKPVLAIIDGRIDKYLTEPAYKKQAREHVKRELDILVKALMVHKKVTRALAPDNKTYKTRDQVEAFGERSVIGILEAFLNQHGIKAKAVNDVAYQGEDGKTSKSGIHRGIQRGIALSLTPHKDKIGEQVLIIGGHVKGVLRGMEKEIGRSFTDTTAVNVTVALEKLLDIPVDSTVAWKAVAGVLSGDPNQLDKDLNTPRLHHDVSLDEAMELAGANSTLMQVDALDLAREEEIPLALKNIKTPAIEGTTFHVDEATTDLPFKIVMANKMSDTISCKIPRMAVGAGFVAALAQAFADENVSINDIMTSSTTIDFTVNLPSTEGAIKELRNSIRKAKRRIRKLEVNGETYRCNAKWRKQNKANVVIIGDELLNNTGILSVITAVLASERIGVEMITQTEEQRKISFYVNHKDANRAVQILHRVFLDKDKALRAGVMESVGEIFNRFLSS